MAELEGEGRIVFRYSDARGGVTPEANPNGSLNHIAGIVNRRGNVLGMMPHPDRAVEEVLGSVDGLPLFRSLVGTEVGSGEAAGADPGVTAGASAAAEVAP